MICVESFSKRTSMEKVVWLSLPSGFMSAKAGPRKSPPRFAGQGRWKDRREVKRGPKSRLTPETTEYLRSRVKEQPDRTLAELQEDLRRHKSVGIGITQLWVALRRLGLRLKKSHSTPPNRTASESKRSVSSGGRKPDKSIRRSSSSLLRAASPRKMTRR